jgi:hypothetical protein
MGVSCAGFCQACGLFGLEEEKVMSKLIAENQTFTKEVNLKSLLQAGQEALAKLG